MVKIKYLSGRSCEVIGPEEIANTYYEEWIREEGEEPLNHFGNMGNYGLCFSNSKEGKKLIFVTDDESELYKQHEIKVMADKKLADRYKAKPKPLTLLHVTMTEQEKAEWLIKERKKIKKKD